ncbi:MAG: phosphomannomutase, partial [Alphaproteobacteria bacterium]
MTGFNHRFDPTVLREYDIRGIVGKTLNPEDAYAIGRCFGSIVSRGGGTRVAVGYDGRLHSPEMEAQLVAGLRACGLEVVRIGLCATPMLYYAAYALEADGAAMVTGSHNPPDYNGFKMMIGKKPFYGAQIQQIGRMATEGDVVPEAAGSDRTVDIATRYADRVLQDWDGGDRALKVVWDPGNGSA